MNPAQYPILACTNGDEHTRPALNYSVFLAGLLNSPLTFLGVTETGGDPARVKQFIQDVTVHLPDLQIPFEMRLERGDGPEQFARVANSAEYLTVLGPLGRPAWQRMVQGRSVRRVLSHLQHPLFYVRDERQSLKNVLLCLGGLDYSRGIEEFTLSLAQVSGAQVNILHVVEPVTLQYPTSRAIRDHWKTIMDTDTPQGRHLRSVYEKVRGSDVAVEFLVRHGNVVHEIIEEARHGKYDLIAMGSSYSSHSLRHLYMPNVTAEVAEAIVCPVLTMRTLINAGKPSNPGEIVTLGTTE